MELLLCKDDILKNLQAVIRQKDIDKATASSHRGYAAELIDRHHLTDSLALLGLRKCRILAQIRLNQTQFYWNNTKHELRFEKVPILQLGR
jgi:hypothetical protein